METAARFSDPVRDRAYHVVTHELGERPPLSRPLLSYGNTRAVCALIGLEEAFGILIDVDEAAACPDLSALLDIVSERAAFPVANRAEMLGRHARALGIPLPSAPAAPAPPCALYDLAAYRNLTPTFLGIDLGSQPSLQLDPAVLDAAFPPSRLPGDAPAPRPGYRPLNRADVLRGVVMGLILFLAVTGWIVGGDPPPSPGVLVAALR